MDGVTCWAFVMHHMKLLTLGVSTGNAQNVPSGDQEMVLVQQQVIRSQIARELLAQELETEVALAGVKYR